MWISGLICDYLRKLAQEIIISSDYKSSLKALMMYLNKSFIIRTARDWNKLPPNIATTKFNKIVFVSISFDLLNFH